MKSNVYTRGGDKGTTSLVGGSRVLKNSPRLEAYGTVDELNSWLGLIAAYPSQLPAEAPATLQMAMNTLFDLGAILATEPESKWQPAPLSPERVRELETAIDILDARLPRHNRFILPGGTPLSAQTHIARCVARRAERRIIALSQELANSNPPQSLDPVVVEFVNRLSDYLFVLARAINNISDSPNEIFWEKSC
ncbi:MAG: cob(I)yrinic acid a,c-diamide adenosyltransferase [Muribaculaceae bacterium]|nr:cob(I)yrinic acid a,c-diamide adenosyltransferase [Muribaculaceae bacterium]